MYPGMWKGVPKTARISLRNTIEQLVEGGLIETLEDAEADE